MAGTRYIVAGSLIDGSGAAVRRNVFLAVENGVITAIGPVADLPRQEGAPIDDLSHCTLVPALVDCSVSLARSPAMEMKLFLKAGYSLEETIRCASENGARFFGMEKLGVLTVGRPATFLITRGTAGQLPRKLAYLEGIYVEGAPSSTYRKNPVKVA
jgi:imidazolonepropionase-like amidohydrolase